MDMASLVTEPLSAEMFLVWLYTRKKKDLHKHLIGKEEGN
jgi:hypothetical protein